MYYEFGTMIAIKKDASPFVNHDKGISIPSIDVVGEIVGIHPSNLSYAVRLSKKYVLTFDEDDIYGLPGWMSDKHYMFHKMLGSIAAAVHPFYYVEEFEGFVSRAEEKQSTMYFPGYKFDPKFEYKKIIFNGPCTIILWKDGTKTIAKASDGEMFDPEKGVAICFMKRALGETEGKKVLRKANKDFYDEVARAASKEFDEELKKATFPLPKGVTFRPFTFNTPIDNKVIKVAKEGQDDNLAIGSRCSTCEYFDRPMTKDPCCHCLSGDQYKKREEKEDD